MCFPAKPEKYWPSDSPFRVVAVVAELEVDGQVLIKVFDKSKSRRRVRWKILPQQILAELVSSQDLRKAGSAWHLTQSNSRLLGLFSSI